MVEWFVALVGVARQVGAGFVIASNVIPPTRTELDAARGLNPSTPPRRMILRCRPSLAARFVLLGATDIPAVSLVSADDH